MHIVSNSFVYQSKNLCNQVKLANFGLAKATKFNDVKSYKGTAFWMAPEVCLSLCQQVPAGHQVKVGHPWVQVDGVAPDKPLDSAALSCIKQFSAMNKLKKMALRVIAEILSEEEKRAGIKRDLEKIQFPGDDCYLPTTPNKLVKSIQLEKSSEMSTQDLVNTVASILVHGIDFFIFCVGGI
ncbi:hypothetical protein L2E82_46906 [Cichorium intybus]|uniref:Uncharacterized protein n=1 Tax=Cichorium intybus TaxID=13427 RepID=A0ACB8YY67_CICIN|nr:hypothetical protein L2E82_46906 [Cichorium intybus]